LSILTLLFLILSFLLSWQRQVYGLVIYLIFWILVSLDNAPGPLSNLASFGASMNQYLILVLFFNCLLKKRLSMSNASKKIIYTILILFIYLTVNHFFFSIDIEYSSLSLNRILKFLILMFTVSMSIKSRYDFTLISYSLMMMTVFQMILFIYHHYSFPNAMHNVFIDNISKIILTCFIFISLSKNKPISINNIFLLIVLFMLTQNTFLIGSRRIFGAYILSGVCIYYFNLFKKKQKIRLYYIFIVFIFLGLVNYTISPEGLNARIEQSSNLLDFENDQRNRSWSGRVILWASAINMFLDSPIFGNGVGVSWLFLDDYAWLSDGMVLDDYKRVHNLLLKSLAEIGIIGTVIYYYLWFFLLIRLYKIYKSNHLNDVLFANLTLCYFCGLLIMIPFSIFGWSGYLNKPFWFFTGIVVAASNIKDVENKKLI
tara:strand:+ start:57 stop:1343 length:1287 start_codon:yes stop_codon:yes gene_type:complete